MNPIKDLMNVFMNHDGYDSLDPKIKTASILAYIDGMRALQLIYRSSICKTPEQYKLLIESVTKDLEQLSEVIKNAAECTTKQK